MIDIIDEEKLTAAQVAPMLGVSVRQVYALAAAGDLPCLRIGGSKRFTRELVREYLEKCRSTTTKPYVAGAMNSGVSLRDADSELQNYFRRRGIGTKRKPKRPAT